MTVPGRSMSDVDFQAWLVARIAPQVERRAEEIDIDVPIASYGLNSVSALTLVADAEDEFGVEVDPADLWDHPTVRTLGRRLRELSEH
jgi:acyl carrier protein